MAYQHIQLLKFTMKLSSPKPEVEALNAFIMEGDLPEALATVEALSHAPSEDTLLLHAIRAQLLLSAVELALSKHSDCMRDVGMESTGALRRASLPAVQRCSTVRSLPFVAEACSLSFADYAESVGKHVFEENQVCCWGCTGAPWVPQSDQQPHAILGCLSFGFYRLFIGNTCPVRHRPASSARPCYSRPSFLSSPVGITARSVCSTLR